MIKPSLEEKIQLVADEQSRRIMRQLFPHYTPIYLSGKKEAYEGDKGEHSYFIVHTCDVMKIRQELGMSKIW